MDNKAGPWGGQRGHGGGGGDRGDRTVGTPSRGSWLRAERPAWRGTPAVGRFSGG